MGDGPGTVMISLIQIRRYLLAYQHLSPPRRLRTDEDILAYIRKVGCIQYDPLRTTARNPDLVLQSRCEGYTEKILYRLLYEERRLIDWWDKNMAVWTVEDWPCFARERAVYRERYEGRKDELAESSREIFALLDDRDFISSKDLTDGTKVSWSWAPTSIARAALESMYYQGELIIHHKEGTRKYYGPAARLLPPELPGAPDPFPNDEKYHDWLVRRRIASVGLLWNRSGGAWIGTGLKKTERAASISRLHERGDIVPLEVEGLDEPFFLPAAELTRLEEVRESESKAPEAALVAPLDNLLWDRSLISKLFDFDYTWEVYTPIKQRRYGYYVLPVLCGDRFVARCEPVLDRKSSTLIIKNWWWEPEIKPSPEMEEALSRCLREFCGFLGADELSLPADIELPEGFAKSGKY